MYSIGELAELAGVSARTLRYYDREGILKPSFVNESGYRFYGEQEVDLLQQILFYRERGLDLGSIRQILYEKDFDVVEALEEHLHALEEQREHTDALIRMVRRSIMSMKGECRMSDKEKFEAFKERVIKDHEEMYGAEAREKYGDEEVDEVQRKANEKERIKKGTKSAVVTVLAFCLMISAAVFLLAPRLMGIFISPEETEIIGIGAGYLRIEGACYCGIGILFLLYGYFRAVERPKISLLLTIISLGTRVLLAYAFAPMLGVGAIWWAIPIGWALADVTGAVLVRRERNNSAI